MIKTLGDQTPKVADTAWISEFAYVVGNVEIGEYASIWPGVTIRGDGPTTIVIGDNVNIQEGSVVHGDGLVIEDNVSVGHCVVVHCDRVGRGSLLGNNCPLLNRVTLGENCLIAANSVVIGGIHLSVDEFHENAQLSYSLARVHWGKGLTTEAATAIVDWGFGALGLMKVYGNSDLRHVASWRVMEKIGMTREGILRSHRRAREGRSDRIYYGILREDWEAASADDSGGQQ